MITETTSRPRDLIGEMMLVMAIDGSDEMSYVKKY